MTVGTAILCLVVVLLLSCHRFVDSLRPFSPSTVTVSGLVIDSISGKTIEMATVLIVNDDVTSTTDAEGYYRFRNVTTGEHEVRITATGYDTLESVLDVTLDPPQYSYQLIRTNVPPRFDSVYVDTADQQFLNDTLTITFSANDSTGGITAVTLFCDDGLAGIEKEVLFDQPVYSVHDSFSLCCFPAGTWTASLRLIGEHHDTTVKTLTLNLSKPQKPSFALLRTGTDGFIVDKPGYLQVIVSDPDSVVTHMTIDWDDGTGEVTSYALQGTYWHVYTKEQPVRIAVFLHGNDGHIDSTRLELDIIKINPPRLDNNLRFLPSQYLAPHDSTVLILVRVLEIKDNLVKQIIWIVNENDPSAFAYHRDTLSVRIDTAGDTIGTTFFHEFPTAQFKGTNIVEVRVVDGDDNSSTVSGTFFIAGKGE